ncbi:hypothetical protein [Methylocystis heyeri]|uniref:Uncharacterized protein n=1 Tax=Methylocystis heyeri TaxID=391905 RepID=A0A6B8KF72_9HYPH|nr:hypothetical protein [Methylocystis heyeri]QGM47124.1 hypothetical protein H2LOC_016290 [Methylocystis heyeri]
MFPKSAQRFLDKNMLSESHVPEKRAAVFGQEHAQRKPCSRKARSGFWKKNMFDQSHVPEKRPAVLVEDMLSQ